MAFEIMNYKTAEKLVNSAIAHTVKGDQLIHEAAVQALAHAAPQGQGGHGDCTLIDKLLKGLGKSVFVGGLKTWVKTYSPVDWNGDGKVGMHKPGAKNYKPFDLEAANANPFYDMSEVQAARAKEPISGFTILKRVQAMKAMLQKAIKDGRFEGDEEAALAFADALGGFANEYVKAHPVVVRDGDFNPDDKENAVPGPQGRNETVGVQPPAATPRRARKVAKIEDSQPSPSEPVEAPKDADAIEAELDAATAARLANMTTEAVTANTRTRRRANAKAA